MRLPTNNNNQRVKKLIYHFNNWGFNYPLFLYIYKMLKNLKDGEKFPADFWNYNINPITGYYIQPQLRKEHNDRTAKKYAKPPQGI